MPISRRLLLPALALPFLARAQIPAAGSLARLDGTPVAALDAAQLAQRRADSPAPPGRPGAWQQRAPLPVPRAAAGATVVGGKLHLVGGYGGGRLDSDFHHVYDPASDTWANAAPLPRAASHVAVVADGPLLYAFGGFTKEDRGADTGCFLWDSRTDRWRAIAPLPRARGAASAIAFGGRIHLIGGASNPADERASVAWHEVYLPVADRWERLRPLPAGRDHAGVVSWGGNIHVAGGGFNTSSESTGLHHLYDVTANRWQSGAPMPTPRAGHGLALLGGRVYAIGGEGWRVADDPDTGAIYGTVESWDPHTDAWWSHQPLPTPRHDAGVATIGTAIHVAGGFPVVGDGVLSTAHEVFAIAG